MARADVIEAGGAHEAGLALARAARGPSFEAVYEAVRIAVATFVLMPVTPTLASTAVAPANNADKSAQLSHCMGPKLSPCTPDSKWYAVPDRRDAVAVRERLSLRD